MFKVWKWSCNWPFIAYTWVNEFLKMVVMLTPLNGFVNICIFLEVLRYLIPLVNNSKHENRTSKFTASRNTLCLVYIPDDSYSRNWCFTRCLWYVISLCPSDGVVNCNIPCFRNLKIVNVCSLVRRYFYNVHVIVTQFEIVFSLIVKDNNIYPCTNNIRLSYNIYKCFSALSIRMCMST